VEASREARALDVSLCGGWIKREAVFHIPQEAHFSSEIRKGLGATGSRALMVAH
jgi:hypothetical protein